MEMETETTVHSPPNNHYGEKNMAMKAETGPGGPPILKEPLQKRSRETRAKIVKAATEVFTELGFDETTTHLIAERAGLSVGGMYAHFRNKEELFLHILEKRSQDIYQETKRCLEEINSRDLPLEEGLEYYITTMYKAHIRHGRLNVEMDKFTRMNPAAYDIHETWENEEIREAVGWLKGYGRTINVDDMETALVVVGRATHEVFHYLYKNRHQVDEQKVLGSLILMFQRFLGRPRP
jgi:AcrR family transcriptional regulator